MKKRKLGAPGRKSLEGIVAIAVILLTAIFFRVQFNNVVEYSRADELYYMNYAKAIFTGGLSAFPDLVSGYIGDPDSWLFPHPTRWGYIILTGAWCKLIGVADTRTIATLSTLAGILSVFLTYLIGLQFMPRRAALLAAAFSITSPIQLAMGRRALQDEVHCAVILLTFWLFMLFLNATGPHRQRALLLAGTIAAMTFSLSIKESALFVLPMFLAALLLTEGWRAFRSPALLIFVVPPVLYVLGFLLLGGTLDQFFRLVYIVQGSGVLDNPYVPAFQSGPPQRVAIDFMVLSPLVCFLAVASVGRLTAIPDDQRVPIVRLIAAAITLLLVFSILPSKNIRNFTMADPFLRLVAAWGANDLAERWKEWGSTILILLVIGNGIAELWIFQTVFIEQQVYDPVTYQLFRALRMIPAR